MTGSNLSNWLPTLLPTQPPWISCLCALLTAPDGYGSMMWISRTSLWSDRTPTIKGNSSDAAGRGPGGRQIGSLNSTGSLGAVLSSLVRSKGQINKIDFRRIYAACPRGIATGRAKDVGRCMWRCGVSSSALRGVMGCFVVLPFL